MRSIETSVSTDGNLKSFEGWTNKFIYPPFDFNVANTLTTAASGTLDMSTYVLQGTLTTITNSGTTNYTSIFMACQAARM